MKHLFKAIFLLILLISLGINPYGCGGGGDDNDDNQPVSKCQDQDGDGYGQNCSSGTDCKDNNASVYPGAPEQMDGVDNQCSGDAGYGLVDEGFLVAEGEAHSCVPMSGGGVKCWGDNGEGQLGDGGTAPSSLPADVTAMNSALFASAGGDLSCAGLAGGAVECWGEDQGGVVTSSAPFSLKARDTVSGLSGAIELAAGSAHLCGLFSDGSVKCAGDNEKGQLGDGSTTDSPSPVTVSGLGSAIALAAGDRHACALVSGGGVYCWGDNSSGQLGAGNTADSALPSPVSGLGSARAIAAGGDHTCVVLETGAANCWGANGEGQLGNGGIIDSSSPVYVTGLTTVTSISAGKYHSCARLATGVVRCWGDNTYGQLGSPGGDSSTPRSVSFLVSNAAVTSGDFHSCVRPAESFGFCWGRNDAGQLGDGSTQNSDVPTRVCFDSDCGKEWTVFVYMDADNNLEEYGVRDMNELEKIGSQPEVDVIVLMDRIDGYNSSNGDWKDARTYYVTKDLDTSNINSTLLVNNGEINMGDPAVLENFLEWGIMSFPAEKYALILWDHGSGWKARSPKHAVKGVAYDDTSDDFLSNDDLESALSNALSSTGAGHLELVGFDACLMQMMEIAYYMADYSAYMVGSEETEPLGGYVYDEWLAELAADPDMDGGSLGEAISRTYYNDDSYNETQSVVDLSMIDGLADDLDLLAERLIVSYPTYSSQISSARMNAASFDDPDYVDVYDFADNIYSASVPSGVREAADYVKTSFDAAVIYNYSYISGAEGLSIYYPLGGYNSKYNGLDFAIDTHWDDYISNLDAGVCAAYDYSISCGGQDNGSTSGMGNDLNFYSCTDWDESGPDVIYRLQTSSTKNVTAFLESVSGGDLDVFLLDNNGGQACSDECMAAGDLHVTVNSVPAGTYFVVVDGWNGAVGTYTLKVTCD